jgi:hypothetical protein
VTIDVRDSGLQTAQFGLGGGAPCPANTVAFVNPVNPSGDAGFFVMFYD